MLFGTLMEAYLTYLRIHIWFSMGQWLLNALMMERNLWSLSVMTFTPKTYLKVMNFFTLCSYYIQKRVIYCFKWWRILYLFLILDAIHDINYLLGESVHMLVHKNGKLGIHRDYGFVKLDASGKMVSFNISDLKKFTSKHVN